MRNPHFVKSGLAFILAAVFICLPLFHVEAQSVAIKVSPTKIELSAEPGEVINQKIKVTNDSDSGRLLYPLLRDSAVEGEEGKPRLIEPGSEQGAYLASWIEISEQGFDFGPRETKEIPFRIKVPADAGPGGYYGAVLMGTEPPSLNLNGEDKGAGMSISQQTASLILLTVKGDVREDAELREFDTDKRVYNTPFDVRFNLRIENGGNTYVKPQGAITIHNMFGRRVAEVIVNKAGANVLQNSKRSFSDIVWSGDLGFGKYRAEIGLSYGTSPDAGGQGISSLTATTDFWIIPWKFVLPALLALLVFFGGSIFLAAWYKNRAVRQALGRVGLDKSGRSKGRVVTPSAHFTAVFMLVLSLAFLILLTLYFVLF